MIKKVIIFVFIGFLVYCLIIRRKTAEGNNVGFCTNNLFRDNVSNETPLVTPENVDDNTIKIKSDFTPPVFFPITKNGTEYDRVIIDGLENFSNPNEPVLPVKCLKIFIPLDKRVIDPKTRIECGEKIQLSGTHNIELGHNEVPFSNSDTAVATRPEEAFCCEPSLKQACKLITKQTLYKYEIYVFNLYPVEYIQQKGQVSYYKTLTLILELEKKPQNDQFGLDDFIASGYFHPSYETRIRGFVDNPDTVSTPFFNNDLSRKRHYRDLPEEGKYEYLIITDERLERSFKQLIDYKIKKGLTARVETTQSIYQNYDGERPDGGIDDQTKIREFIKDAHIQWGTQYVLLGGDTDIIPCRLLWDTNTSIASDLYYACLDGTFDHNKNGIYGEMGDGEEGGEVDLLAEVYIGRAPVSTIEEVKNFVRKTLMHEIQPTTEWKNLMVGECLGLRGLTNACAKPYLEEIRLGSNAHGYSTKGIEASSIESLVLYDEDNEWGKQTLIDFMNDENIRFYNHMGHSSYSKNMKLTIDDIDNLRNPIPFFVYSQGCYAASFDNIDKNGDPHPDDSMAEHFVKTAFGAFAYIGNTRTGWYDHFSTNGCSQRFHRHFWDCILSKGIKQLGKALQLSKEKNIGLIGSQKNRWCYFQITLLGDPEISTGGFDITGCTFLINSPFDYLGGTGSIDVTTKPGCSWTALTDSDWIKITSEERGTGSGILDYEVGENPENSYRMGQIIIKDNNGQVKASFNVEQKGKPCNYTLSPAGITYFNRFEVEDSFQISTESGCPWTALADSLWIKITSDESGNGSGTLYYKVLDNPTGSARTGTISIKDNNDQVKASFSVNQIPDTKCIVGSYNTPGYANSVHTQDSYAYVADGGSGLQVIDIQNPENPAIVGSCDTPNNANGVYVQGLFAYVADSWSGLQVIDIANPESPTIVGSCDTPGYAWGAHVQDSYAYVADGGSGLQVIDIQNPQNPAIVGSCDTPDNANGVYVQESFAFVADGGSGLQVINIANKKTPTIVGSCNTPGSAYGVYVQGSFAFVADRHPYNPNMDKSVGLQVIDIAKPENPTIVGSCHTPGSAYGVYILGSFAFVADRHSGLQLIDITKLESPTIVGFCDTPDNALGVHVQGSYIYVADGDSGLQVISSRYEPN